MKILLIEDNPGDARLAREILREAVGKFTISVAEKLASGLEFLASHEVDAVLLDMNLPDSHGLETFTRLQTQFPHHPVVIMTGSDDEALAMKAVQSGAQDYLVKGQVDGRLLQRALTYAVERKKADEALRKSERRWATTLASIGDAVITTDVSGRITFMNGVAEVMTGWALGEASARPLTEVFRIINENTRRAAEDPVIRIIREGVIVGLANHTLLVRKDGVEIPIDDSGAPIRDRDGHTMGAVLVFRDVTERKKSEQMKDEFIGMVSHEIRTPLTVFLGAVRLAMTEGVTAEEQQDLLKDASQSAQAMARLVENLIELSRYQADRLRLSTELLDVAAVVRDTVENWRDDYGHRFSLAIAEGLPPVRADRLRVVQVLHNLLDNAAKYSPAGTEIHVSVREDGDCLLVAVSDRGKGISAEEKLKLFQSFERLNETSVTRPGLGLGLLVCRRLVEAHGGEIWVESAPNKGSTFYFTLPVTDWSRRAGK